MWQKVFYISSAVILTLVKCDKNLFGNFKGSDWHNVASFRPGRIGSLCYNFTIVRDDVSPSCNSTCYDSNWDLGIFTIDTSIQTKQVRTERLFLAIRDAKDIEKALNTDCWCSYDHDWSKAIVVREVNENYFLIYEKPVSRDYDYRVDVLSKGLPAEKELQELSNKVPELKNRNIIMNFCPYSGFPEHVIRRAEKQHKRNH